MANKFSKHELKCLLQQGIATVTFTKVDGTERVMRCTLKPDIISVDSSDDNNTQNSNVISVWDLDINAWRSFRVESIKTWVLSAE